MKIARYESLENGFTTIIDHRDDGSCWADEDDSGYLRVTEIVEVEFIDLPAESVVPKQVKELEAAKTRAMVKYQMIADSIDEKISKLLAITHSSESEDGK